MATCLFLLSGCGNNEPSAELLITAGERAARENLPVDLLTVTDLRQDGGLLSPDKKSYLAEYRYSIQLSHPFATNLMALATQIKNEMAELDASGLPTGIDAARIELQAKLEAERWAKSQSDIDGRVKNLIMNCQSCATFLSDPVESSAEKKRASLYLAWAILESAGINESLPTGAKIPKYTSVVFNKTETGWSAN